MYGRFEDRLNNTALEMQECLGRIEARTPQELTHAFTAIEDARRAGHWVALALDYELAELFEPRLQARPAGSQAPLTALVFANASHVPPWSSQTAPRLHASLGISQHDYRAAIEQIQAGLRAGEFYQINYTVPLHIQADMPPRELYAALASRHPVAYGAYLDLGGRHILSLSPELFLEKRGTHIRTRPMKGTRPRDADPTRDKANAQDLRDSQKDKAENVMIVDLLRNDLGRIARTGSVRVSSLFDVEQYASVWTMTSTIEAHLPDDCGLETLLRALFPCGSITGAPKLAAMQCIRRLESWRRGIYCGSLGYVNPQGDLFLNVGIRTLELDDEGKGIFGAGGGIVLDSDPDQEWQECLWKARVLQTPITLMQKATP
ncbi:aminodeoxychorismate synthase component I [Alcaligenes sp. SDU_A2]|uniref:aminodeoxychorismate synthase component I n=1 Tax=Alcaligenes sp. SDU_A2 TaxID=3136634 RepID=UPI00311D6C45